MTSDLGGGVLWEIAVGTEYFLDLKKTYKLALKTQRRLITHPKIRQFLHRRTRGAFDMALKVHKNIQERDLEVGRTLGNWILCSLDKAKPSAQISHHAVGPTVLRGNATTNMIKHVTKLSHTIAAERLQRLIKTRDRVYARSLYACGLYNRHTWRYRFPTLAMI